MSIVDVSTLTHFLRRERERTWGVWSEKPEVQTKIWPSSEAHSLCRFVHKKKRLLGFKFFEEDCSHGCVWGRASSRERGRTCAGVIMAAWTGGSESQDQPAGCGFRKCGTARACPVSRWNPSYGRALGAAGSYLSGLSPLWCSDCSLIIMWLICCSVLTSLPSRS